MLAEAVIEAKLGRHPGTPAHPFKLPPDWTAHVEMSKHLSEKSHFRNLGQKKPARVILREMMEAGATSKQIAARLKKSHATVIRMMREEA